MNHRYALPLGVILTCAVPATLGDTMDDCLLLAMRSAAPSTTVAELRELCATQASSEPPPALSVEAVAQQRTAAAQAAGSEGAMQTRMALQRYSRDNPFTITALRPNYILPVDYTKDPYNRPGADIEWDDIEAQFQLSLQVGLFENLLGDNGHLSVGYTARSFWQAYNNDDSSPFRNTDHEPELIFTLENDWEIFGFRNVANQFIINHQSNGRSGDLSRSWNRFIFNTIFERERLALSLRTWYRLREDKKDGPDDPRGDDNPDIEHYLGHFELLAAWEQRQNVFSLQLRNNLRSDNRGAVELAWSFPLSGRIKGYIKYFNGYGESLLDYDQSTESIGIGFLISDWL